MMRPVIHRWSALTLRERLLIGTMIVLVVGIVGWFGIWGPLDRGLQQARGDYAVALERRAAVTARLSLLDGKAAQTNRGASATVDLPQFVSAAASEAGFTLQRANAQGADAMAVSIESARAGPLLAWLAALEGQGINVETISISPAPANDAVAVQMLLRRVRS